jgi:hypothetical protein
MSSGRILAQKLGKSQLIIVKPRPQDLAQHDSHGPDDLPKTIDYHHLDMSRDDGMDEPGIDWFCGCHLVLVGYFGSKVGQITADFCQTPTTRSGTA